MAKNIQNIKLTPTKREDVRQQTFDSVLLLVNGYPTAILHVDTFWNATDKDNKIYRALCSGETITGTMTIDDNQTEE